MKLALNCSPFVCRSALIVFPSDELLLEGTLLEELLPDEELLEETLLEELLPDEEPPEETLLDELVLDEELPEETLLDEGLFVSELEEVFFPLDEDSLAREHEESSAMLEEEFSSVSLYSSKSFEAVAELSSSPQETSSNVRNIKKQIFFIDVNIE